MIPNKFPECSSVCRHEQQMQSWAMRLWSFYGVDNMTREMKGRSAHLMILLCDLCDYSRVVGRLVLDLKRRLNSFFSSNEHICAIYWFINQAVFSVSRHFLKQRGQSKEF